MLPCRGSTADHLVEHPDVAAISFTGSPEVGWGIRARAPRKRVGLELGNNAPVIVEPSADLTVAAARITAGGFAFSGQTCISVQRVYAHRSLRSELVDALRDHAAQLTGGDPADPAVDIGACSITPDDTRRVGSWIDEAVGDGATLVRGGTDDGGVLAATVLDEITPGMRVSTTEVFGPVVGVAAYDDFDEAVALANDTRYGLQAGVFTRDVGTALDAAARLDFGGVLINEVPTWRADQQPYGGVRDSGNTREGPAYAVEELTERRMVVIQG